MTEPLLVTIAFSHFCWKARWALEHAGIAYRESPHLPLLHVISVRRAGGKRSTPTLVTADGVLCDSSDILAWVDRQRPEAGLYGASAADRAEVLRLEERFDEVLGPHGRRWAYFHLLPMREATLAYLGSHPGIPAVELRAVRAFYRPIVALMRRAMRIDAEGAARSLVKVDEIFAEVAALVADGRRYLFGDALTAADITFAALCAPVLVYDHPEARMPPFSVLPPAVARQIEAWRAHPAGVFAQRIVRDHLRSQRPIQ